MKLSIIMPFCNEEDNIERVEKEVAEALEKIDFLEDYEVVCIEDGSTDQTYEKLKQIKNPKFKIYQHKQNYGLTADIYTGIQCAKFDVIGYIDSDLQTDPNEFEKLLLELQKGYDCVSGVRQKQKVHLIRKISSGIGHLVPKFILKTNLQDMNCPLKVFRKECIADLTFYNNFHRVLSYLFVMRGYKVKELPIKHYERTAGESKFGFGVWKRLREGIRLMYVVRWMKKNRINPELK